MNLKKSQLGATLTEFITIGPLVFVLGMTGIQYTQMYNAKTNLTYASYEAARAGAIENADPDAIQSGLIKGFLPYLSASNGFDGSVSDSAHLLQTITAAEAPYMRIEILNPNKEAFEDFNDDNLKQLLRTRNKVIPNKQTDIENLRNIEGQSSGLTIEEANVLKLRITYGYEPKMPLVGDMFAQAYDLFSGRQDAFNTMLFAVNRIPIVVDVSSQMLSPAVQNGLGYPTNDPVNTDSTSIGDHQTPDLTQIDLPDRYEDMDREEIVNDILTNGRDENISNTDWVKILIAVGLITVGVDQISSTIQNFEDSGTIVGSDLVADHQNSYTCSVGSTAYESDILNDSSQASLANDPFQSNVVPIVGAGAVGGAEVAAGAAILGGAACATNEYCPELVGDILTSAGNGIHNTVEGVLGVFSSDSPKTGNDELDEVLEDAVPTDDGDKGYEYPDSQEELIEEISGIDGAVVDRKSGGVTVIDLPDGTRINTYPARGSTGRPGWSITKPGATKPKIKGDTPN